MPIVMADKKDDIIVFIIRRDTKCSECDEFLRSGSWITLIGDGEERDAVCMECSDLDHLVFLPRGDAAVTRRAGKHSKLRAVVLEWARRRQRYERQGILVEATALDRAEEECIADADLRSARAKKRHESEAAKDNQHVERFRETLLSIYPSAPEEDALAIARHACERNSGRVGRSAAARELDPGMVQLAVRAAIRHQHTDYDLLLMSGMPRSAARQEIATVLDRVEAQWMTDS